MKYKSMDEYRINKKQRCNASTIDVPVDVAKSAALFPTGVEIARLPVPQVVIHQKSLKRIWANSNSYSFEGVPIIYDVDGGGGGDGGGNRGQNLYHHPID